MAVPKKPGVYTLSNGRKMRRFPDGHVEFLPGAVSRTPAAADAAAADAPKRRKRRAKPSAAKRAMRWVTKNPGKSALVAAALTVAAVPVTRQAVVNSTKAAYNWATTA